MGNPIGVAQNVRVNERGETICDIRLNEYGDAMCNVVLPKPIPAASSALSVLEEILAEFDRTQHAVAYAGEGTVSTPEAFAFQQLLLKAAAQFRRIVSDRADKLRAADKAFAVDRGELDKAYAAIKKLTRPTEADVAIPCCQAPKDIKITVSDPDAAKVDPWAMLLGSVNPETPVATLKGAEASRRDVHLVKNDKRLCGSDSGPYTVDFGNVTCEACVVKEIQSAVKVIEAPVHFHVGSCETKCGGEAIDADHLTDQFADVTCKECQRLVL